MIGRSISIATLLIFSSMFVGLGSTNGIVGVAQAQGDATVDFLLGCDDTTVGTPDCDDAGLTAALQEDIDALLQVCLDPAVACESGNLLEILSPAIFGALPRPDAGTSFDRLYVAPAGAEPGAPEIGFATADGEQVEITTYFSTEFIKYILDDGSGSCLTGTPNPCDGDNEAELADGLVSVDVDESIVRVAGIIIDLDDDDAVAVIDAGEPIPGTETLWPDRQGIMLNDLHIFPGAADLDNDGHEDALELICGSNPTNPASTCDDIDADGLEAAGGDPDPRNPYDPDTDGDTVPNEDDLCEGSDDRLDLDSDGIPDGCDGDRDGDGVDNGDDFAPDDASETTDTDGDGVGDNSDACPGFDDSSDQDTDGIPDACDDDRDGDGVLNGDDAFPDDADETADTDGDGFGDVADNCPADANAAQADVDGDGIGDACDLDNEDGPTGDSDGDGSLNNVDCEPDNAEVSDEPIMVPTFVDDDVEAPMSCAIQANSAAALAAADALTAAVDEIVSDPGATIEALQGAVLDLIPEVELMGLLFPACSEQPAPEFCSADARDVHDLDRDGNRHEPNGQIDALEEQVFYSNAEARAIGELTFVTPGAVTGTDPVDTLRISVGDDRFVPDNRHEYLVIDSFGSGGICLYGDAEAGLRIGQGDARADACEADFDSIPELNDAAATISEAVNGLIYADPSSAAPILEFIDEDGDEIPEAVLLSYPDVASCAPETGGPIVLLEESADNPEVVVPVGDGANLGCGQVSMLIPLGAEGTSLDSTIDGALSTLGPSIFGPACVTTSTNGPKVGGHECATPPLVDSDGDGVDDSVDACPGFNDNVNQDGDLLPDGCDDDRDGDGVDNSLDAFPDNAAESADSDSDGVGDNADACPGSNDSLDLDTDGIPDGCDDDRDGDGVSNADEVAAGSDPDDASSVPLVDTDGDTIADGSDNCPADANLDQADLDGDGIGDVCDDDRDGDGVNNDVDFAPDDATESADTDGDGVGDNADACEGFDDAADLDTDGIPDGCDDDRDGDGFTNDDETLNGSNPDDATSLPADDDADGVPNAADACEGFDDNADLDADGTPDGCDDDRDGDGFSNDEEVAAASDPDDASSVPPAPPCTGFIAVCQNRPPGVLTTALGMDNGITVKAGPVYLFTL